MRRFESMRLDRRQAFTLASLVVSIAVPAPNVRQPARWMIDPQPEVKIGAGETDTAAMLQTVVGATRLPDGTILVGDRGDYAIRIFGPTGTLLRSFGRKGSGPGEVRFLGRMFRCGDSVYTVDIGEGQRVSVFTLAGKYVRVFRFGAPTGQRTPYMSACNRSGEFVHMGWEQQRDMKAGVFRSVVPVWTSLADSSVGRVIDSLPGSERWGLVQGGQLRGTRPLPLGKQPVIGIGASHVYLGSADRFQVRAVNRSGQAVATLQRSEAPMAVSKADIRETIEREIANRGESARKGVEAAYADMTLPATLPAYTDLRVDAADFVWVRPYPRGSPISVRWSVFDSTGMLTAEVDLPTHLEVFEIGADYVLGRYLDPAEAVPQVRLYRLKRPRK